MSDYGLDDRAIGVQTARFQVLAAASMKLRFVFWDAMPDVGGSTYL
jgi:hypothetical protein